MKHFYCGFINTVISPLQLQSVEETLLEVRDQLSRSGVVNTDLAIPLFDSLLRVALAEVSSCPDPLEEKPDRVSPALGEPVSVTHTSSYSHFILPTHVSLGQFRL